MGRMLFLTGLWFAFWMIAGAVVGAMTAGNPGAVSNGVYYGAFNGAIFAVVASFAWPWIMPKSIDRWLDRDAL